MYNCISSGTKIFLSCKDVAIAYGVVVVVDYCIIVFGPMER